MSRPPLFLGENAYDALAPLYDRAGFDRFSLDLLPRLRSLVAPLGRARLAEIGCGTGSLLAAAAPLVESAVGVDRSAAMLGEARRKGRGLRLVAADARALPLTGPYDAIVCLYDTLNYLLSEGDLRAAFAEARRIARRGARFLFDLNERRAFEKVWADPEPFEAVTGGGTVRIVSTYAPRERLGEAVVTVTAAGGSGDARVLVSRHRQRYHRGEDVARLLARTGWAVVARETIDPFPAEDHVRGTKALWTARAAG